MLEWTEIVQLVVERFGLARKLELDSADSVGAVASAQS